MKYLTETTIINFNTLHFYCHTTSSRSFWFW